MNFTVIIIGAYSTFVYLLARIYHLYMVIIILKIKKLKN